jgi:hypothetical protein
VPQCVWIRKRAVACSGVSVPSSRYDAFNVQLRLPTSHCRMYFKQTVAPLLQSV